MAVLIFIGAPPPPYTRMATRSFTSRRRSERIQGIQARQSRDDDSPLPDPVPSTPPNSNNFPSNDDERRLDSSSDDDLPPFRVPMSNKLQNTPYGHGSASHSVIELQTQDGQNHKVVEADAYLREDLRHRVFVDFETFLINILLLPNDWRVSLKLPIDAVKKDKAFQRLFREYMRLCDTVGTGYEKERSLYTPHADLCNRVIDVVRPKSKNRLSKKDLIQFHRMDPCVVRGSTDKVSPDIVSMLRAIFNKPKNAAARNFVKTIGKANFKSKPSNAKFIPGWPHIIEVKEMKATDDTIDEGYDAIRLLTKDGKDPLTTRPQKKRKYAKDGPEVAASAGPPFAQESETSQGASRGRKRKADPNNEQSSSKYSRVAKTVSSKGKLATSRDQKVLDEDGFAPGTDRAEKARIQCARYALQILSNAGLRSHAIITLIDRDRMQLSYYDRSIIIVSQAIDLANEDDKTLFIAMLIGSHRLTLKQRGILHHIIEDPYITDFDRFNDNSKDPTMLFSGLIMHLQREGEPIKLTLGKTVYRQRGLVGRDTFVVHATCAAWPGRKLVVKISWPSATRMSEKVLLDIAKAKAAELAGEGKKHWVLDHLPDILHEQDFEFDEESAQKLIARMMKGKFVGKEGTYEERVLRITVLEELLPITSLGKDSDYAQVFVDILQCHKWLYDHPRILHRDISMANLMYRIDSEGNIVGVLNDFDLSSLLPIDKATSFRRTGTPPYMALDLLKEQDDSGPHLYRHDLEALFYVMLMICCRHSIIKEPQPRGASQLEEIPKTFSQWFDRGMSWDILGKLKRSFFSDEEPIPVSASFKAFRPCLTALRRAFSEGFFARARSMEEPFKVDQSERDEFDFDNTQPSSESVQGPSQTPFNEETLGGFISYGVFLTNMRRFKGEGLTLKNKEPPAVASS
ncbi:uncharacterized protein EV420DRAFT_704485 [Desarmillaria tabescens]|uniref:Protein kinase domain-containing protein n=1 Tax=Armillaria tabescens TaxID=1929756 RepID=A0AA39K0J3_ARMTA|nr:uncharacterized protein EV420DRAFT_704485 [Desarmillaria tabescens]KAK0452052.1 hypothetical protein EV420DRAFT_704485 [Desarmillaria tabescens]